MKKIILLLTICAMTSIVYSQKDRELKLNEETNLIEVKEYHDNGLISQEGTFNLEGQLHGEWVSFNDRGEKISKGSYVNGQRTGKWYFWLGNSVKEVEYSKNAIASIDGVKNKTRLADNH
ncbi:toxin-antitoxin system YwqK family antitoxin [Muriicola soli]|uniref:Nicotinic acid mononucleotide adenyltransferase n=1 Tax=Muriicola soli TaxID=2507538 RepID=A0A411E5W9_9FLAO|nr:nicotinic acid mononucleotide adenyltransferase [Muriicola soli]QBA63096.1 nicotinic acid mononucleotide adenyltransferase [Muriicola soli]